jgi:hypothetical protein
MPILLTFILIVFIYFIAQLFIQSSRLNKEEHEVKTRTSFRRLDRVRGILTVDNKSIRTYQIGELTIDGNIDVKFFDTFNGDCMIRDIVFRGQSLFSYASQEAGYSDRTAFAIQTLKQMANQGGIHHDLASTIEEIALDVKAMNEYIKAGRLYRTAEEDFAWKF